MPLESGSDRATVRRNFDEVRHGKTYARTRKRFGRRKANKQMIAIVLSKKRESARKHRRR